MTKEQSFFLSTIKEYICGLETAAEDVDWWTIYKYSQSHQLTAIIYHQCKEFLPSDVSEAFKSASLSIIYSNINRRKITEALLLTLKKNSIDSFLVKGLNVAEYYPNWQYRTMGDSDIVVDDLQKTHLLLIERGFDCISQTKDREQHYSYMGMDFEIHDRLVYDQVTNLDSVTEFLSKYKAYLVNNKIDDSVHFIFVLNHLRKHFMNRGVGFRQFVDIAVLVKYNKRIDWNWTEKKLAEIELLSFARVVFYYVEAWFGIPAPFASQNIQEEIFEDSTNSIFKNGVFGFDNQDHDDFIISNYVRKSRFSAILMMKYALGVVFPSYQDLIRAEQYSFLRAKPILLPVAWVYRFGRAIKNKRFSEGRTQISKSFVSKEYIAKREEMFRNWGLE